MTTAVKHLLNNTYKYEIHCAVELTAISAWPESDNPPCHIIALRQSSFLLG